MGEVIGLLLVVGALVGIVLFMMKPLGQGLFLSRRPSGASARAAHARGTESALLSCW